MPFIENGSSPGNKHDLHLAENVECALYPYGMKIFLTSKTAFSILTKI